jgi:hypothetical protein
MSVFTQPTKTSHNVKKSIKETLMEWILPNFKIGDYFVTLTFKPTVKFDDSRRSKDVTHLLNKLNRIVYGKKFDKRTKQLKSFVMFENNCSDGTHIHMILERPVDKSRYSGDFDKLIVDSWYKMNCSGNKNAQKVLPCFDVNRLIRYMTKQIKNENNLERLDVNNLSGIKG